MTEYVLDVEKLSKHLGQPLTVVTDGGDMFYGRLSYVDTDCIELKDYNYLMDDISTRRFRLDYLQGWNICDLIFYDVYSVCGLSPRRFNINDFITTKELQIKPCPLCEGKTEVSRIDGTTKAWFAIRCTDCGLQTPHTFTTEKDAVDFWNRRKESGDE